MPVVVPRSLWRWHNPALLAALLVTGCRLGYEILAEDGLGPSTPGGGGSGSADGGSLGGANGGGGASGPGGAGTSGGTGGDPGSGGAWGGAAGDSGWAPTCFDGELNQDETDVDCGGSRCVPCCELGPFQPPELIEGLGLTGNLYGPALSPDASLLYLSSASGGNEDIYVASRPDRGTTFSNATPLDELNSADLEGTPFLSSDGLSIYFYSNRAGTTGSRDLMIASRNPGDAIFSPPLWLPVVNSDAVDQTPSLTPDELVLVFASSRSGGAGFSDLWISQRPDRSSDFSTPVGLSELNTGTTESGPSLSSDGLTIYFTSNRTGSQDDDIWVATRLDTESPFSAPTLVDVVNSDQRELDPFLSEDRRELFFSSNVSGAFRIWRSIRDCP